MVARDQADREKLSAKAYANPVPSLLMQEGQETRAQARTAAAKLRRGKCRASGDPEDDIVHSPIKYRETEGTKETKLKALYASQCRSGGLTTARLTHCLSTQQRKISPNEILISSCWPTGSRTSCATYTPRSCTSTTSISAIRTSGATENSV